MHVDRNAPVVAHRLHRLRPRKHFVFRDRRRGPSQCGLRGIQIHRVPVTVAHKIVDWIEYFGRLACRPAQIESC